MKKIIVSLIAFLCYYSALHTQTVYFNQTYYEDSISMGSVAVKPISDGYLVVGDFNASGGYSATYLRKINLLGDSEWTQILDGGVQYSAIFFGNSFVATFDGNYFVGAERSNPSALSDFLLIKITAEGDILWKKQYETPTSVETGTHLLIHQNNGCLIAGIRQQYFNDNTTYGPSQFYILKVDSTGNQLWDATYGMWATLLYAEQTQDGGYVLSGYRYSNSTGYDMYVVKTDSIGTLQWQKTFGTNDDDGGCKVFQLANGNLMLMGLIKSTLPDKKGLYLANLSAADGAIIGQPKTHLKNNSYSPSSAHYYYPETGLIIAVPIAYGPPPIWEVAITAISEEGDLLWEAPISSDTNTDDDYIRDIEPTPDAGFVLAGFNSNSPTKSWVLKVDSLGNTCGTAPCSSVEYPIGINPIQTGVRQYVQAQVFPNPVPNNGTAQITYSLPPQLPFVVVEFYDLQGQKVLYQILPAGGLPLNPLKGTFTQTLDLSGLPSGVYVWRLALPGGYERYESTGKILVSEK